MRILIADDSELVRRALRGLLSSEADWQICGEAADGPQAFEKACELRPDLVLLDINMPTESGIQTARQIRREIPQVKILMMSLHDAEQFLPSARAFGADGCVDKTRFSTDLVNAIKNL
jgi:DNA-binding NarL/FixJ family response regulator